MDAEPDDDFDDDKKKVQNNADNKSPVDFLKVYGVVVVTETVGVVVAVVVAVVLVMLVGGCVFHLYVLSIIVTGGGKCIDYPAIRNCIC